MKRWKKLMSVLLALVLTVCVVPVAETGITAQAAAYTSDYRYWSQGASDISGVRSYGCWIVAQAKMIYEANINRESSFNPDVYYYWEQSNGYVGSGFGQINGDRAPVAYAQQRGKNLEYLGFWDAADSQLWFNINAGYYTIVKVNNGGHYVIIDNTTSKQTGQLYCYDSWSQKSSYGTRLLSNYSSRSGGYVYKADNSGTSSQPTISYDSIKDGKYYIKNNSNGQYLVVSGEVDSNGQPINLGSKSTASRVAIVKDANGYIIRFPKVSSSKVINQYANAPQNGTRVTLYTYSGSSSQSWGFQKVSGGYVIRSMYNPDLCLTGNGSDTTTVTYYTGASNQIWTLEAYKGIAVTLSKTNYTYDGKKKTPSVTVKTGEGKKLKEGTHYTLKYSSGRKNIGTYSVTVTLKGGYKGTKKFEFKIVPGKVTEVKQINKKGIYFAWKAVKGAEGYQAYYYNKSEGKYKLLKTTSGTGLRNPNAKGSIKVKVRAYKKVNGKTYYGSFSTPMTFKAKK